MTFLSRFKSILAGLVATSLIFISVPLSLAAEGDIEVDVVVRGESTVGVENATVIVYVLNESTQLYEQYGDSYITNSSGRVNNALVPSDSTFYAVGVDDQGAVYSSSGFDFDNIWTANSDGSIVNVDNGVDRGPAATYVHVYPGYNSANEPEATTTEEDDNNSGSGLEGTPIASGDDDDDDDETTVVAIEDADLFEVEITVYDEFRNPLNEVQVFVYVTGVGLVSTDTTASAGRTDEIMVPEGYEFYAIGYDAEGNSYGGTYDFYYNRANYWQSDDGETIENVSTGLTRIPYLHLYPEEFLPHGYEGDSGDFDPATYECAGFPDAIYEDITPEECTAIEYVFDEGIFSGTDAGYLEWNRDINRAEVTKVMLEAFDYSVVSMASYPQVFPDVLTSGQWYSDYVYNAYTHEIVGGYPDGFFRPAQTINRVEMLRIFTEASNADLSTTPTSFTFWHDVTVAPETEWFIGYANYAFFNELLENDGNLNPAQSMTRLDVIKLLYRASLLD